MNIQRATTYIEGHDAMKEWLVRHGKFDIMDRLSEQCRTRKAKAAIMPIATPEHWVICNRFEEDDGVKFALIIVDRARFPDGRRVLKHLFTSMMGLDMNIETVFLNSQKNN